MKTKLLITIFVALMILITGCDVKDGSIMGTVEVPLAH